MVPLIATTTTSAEQMNYVIEDGTVAYFPNQYIQLKTDKERDAFNNLIEYMENHENVTSVHHNVDLSSEE